MNPQERLAALRAKNANNKTVIAAAAGTVGVPAALPDVRQPARGGNGVTAEPRSPESRWTEGDLVRYEGRVWRVGLVTELRMRLDPITPQKVRTLDGAQLNDYGGSVNVSPNSVLPRMNEDQLDDLESRRVSKLIERGTRTPEHAVNEGERTMAANTATTAAAAAPPPVSEVKQKNKARLEALRNRKVANPPTGGAAVAKAKAAKAPSVGGVATQKTEKPKRECMCGQCGEMVTGYFAQGHDARFKSWLLKVERGTMAVKDLPKKVQDAYEWKKRGDGYIPTTNYKGEKHSGYETSK